MLRFYYYGCRGTETGHFLWSNNGRVRKLHVAFPADLLDGTFAPLDRADPSWKLTYLRFDGHVLSILSKHDNTIDKRPGSNASFTVIDTRPWPQDEILAMARDVFPDCWMRLTPSPRCYGR